MGDIDAAAARRLLACWDDPPDGCTVKISARGRGGSIAHVADMFYAAPNLAKAVIRLEPERDEARALLTAATGGDNARIE